MRNRIEKMHQCAFLFAFIVSFSSWFGPTFAQAPISFIGGDTVKAVTERRDKLVAELQRLGLREGKDFSLTAQTFGGDRAKLVDLCKAVVRSQPALVFAASWDVANELKQHTKTLPIVFAARANLSSQAFRIVDNLQQPEGNLTGFTRYVNLIPKKLQLLKEAFPTIRQIGFVYGVEIRGDRELEYAEAARKLGVELKFRRIEKQDIATLADKLDRWDDAYLIAADDLLTYNRVPYLEQLAKAKRPVIHPEEATDNGVLMHYVAVMDGEAKAAEYISKLLRGAKVRDLAVQEPQEFDLSVNVTTLKRNGLTMSRDVLSRARKVE